MPDSPSTSCYLMLSSYGNPAIYDWSDYKFTLCKLAIQTPQIGAVIAAGSQYQVTWNSDFLNLVNFEYSLNGGLDWTVAQSSISGNQHYYNWNVPSSSSSNCLARLSGSADPNLNSVSGIFRIAALQLSYPTASGIKLQAGKSCEITWTSEVPSTTLNLEYSTNGGTSYNSIASGVNSDVGSFVWTVPDINTTTGLVRITAAGNSAYYAISASPFTISKLQILSPNGSEVWGFGSLKQITWSYYNVSNVKLEYRTSPSGGWTEITPGVPASGNSFNWTVPSVATSNCQVRITDTAFTQIGDESDAVFTISPGITVLTPNGGEFALIEDFCIITWSNIDDITHLLIDYSINAGSSWVQITGTEIAASTGMYFWEVPNIPTSQALIRIRNFSNSEVYDVSDSVFTIGNMLYPPVPVVNLHINVIAGDVYLNWDAVTQNTFGAPLSPDYYSVYSCNSPDGTYQYLGQSNTPQYIDYSAAAGNNCRFYYVIAVKN